MTRFVRLLLWTVVTLGLLAALTWSVLLSPLAAVDFSESACDGSNVCVTLDADGLSAVPPTSSDFGLIVYPGARVVAEAYAPVAERIAAAGYPVYVPSLTANLAILDQDAAAEVIAAHPEIERWVVAGHSLGGAMAARYAADDPRVVGLVLWAAYPEASLDLSDRDLEVASISASNDGLATNAEIEASRARLPYDATFEVIDGGNHAQFGNYGDQRGDNPAAITAERQWDQVAAATIIVLDSVSTG